MDSEVARLSCSSLGALGQKSSKSKKDRSNVPDHKVSVLPGPLPEAKSLNFLGQIQANFPYSTTGKRVCVRPT